MLTFVFISLGVLLRVIPHPPNAAPIAALGLFGGANLQKKHALLVPLAVMFISDLFLGFHSLILWVYGSFLLIGLIGMWLKDKKTVGNVAAASLFASILFYLTTNFGVWLEGKLYPPTLNGLTRCYYMALPFFRNTIVGDLIYTGVFFGAYELANLTAKRLKPLSFKVRVPKTEDRIDDGSQRTA